MSKTKIIIRGPILSASGYGEHCRFLYRSLKKQEDVQIFLDNIPWGQLGSEPSYSKERNEINRIINDTRMYVSSQKATFDACIQVTIPNEFEHYAPVNIGVTAGIETDRITEQWIDSCNKMNKIITISEHARKGISETTVKKQDPSTGIEIMKRVTRPVSVVPYPVPNMEKEDIELELDTSFNFLVMALMGERKNIPNTISWFLEEFQDDEDVGMIVKTAIRSGCEADRVAVDHALKALTADYPNRKCKIYLLHGRLSDEERNSLYSHDKVKALVTLSHGEGFGLPIFEAACNGLPIVAPNWSGHVDFLNHEVKDKKGKTKNKGLFSKVDYELAAVQKSSVWEGVIGRDHKWCYPKKNSYKQKMREVYKDYTLKKSISKKLQQKVLENYESEKIHNLFLSEIMEVLPNISKKKEEVDNEIENMFSSLSKE